jgi:hypothetical protein
MPDTSPHAVRYLDLADDLYLAGAALDAAPQAVFDVVTSAWRSRRCTHRQRGRPGRDRGLDQATAPLRLVPDG